MNGKCTKGKISWVIPLVSLCCFSLMALATPSIAVGVAGEEVASSLDEKMAAITVRGKVTSASDNVGLPGVTIVERGTNNGTVTDIDGDYSLDVADENSVLVFSFVGFDNQEVRVGNQSTIDVELQESLDTMSEVVVTALGIQREKRSLGYSVGEVGGDDIRNVTQENAVNALAGRVAGVTINQMSGPGSSTSVVIRGATSLSSDNQPLFVIDGVPVSNTLNNISRMGDRNEVDYGNPISDLNPDDIEEMTVLKGPSAAALYGARAGNGVILVTTKSGRKGEAMTVNFSSSNVFEMPVRYLDFHYRYGVGNRVAQLDELSSYWSGPELDVGNMAPQFMSPLDENGNRIPIELRSYPDNMRNFLETSVTSTNSLSISGSSDKSTYRLSYTNMAHNGLIPNSDLFRNNLGFSTTYELSPKLSVSADINLSRSNSNDRPSTGNRGANPAEDVYNWSHVDIRDLQNYWEPGQEEIQQRSPSPNHDNPYFIAYGINNSFVRDRAFGNIKLDYKWADNINSHLRLTHDHYTEHRETRIPWSYTRERQGAYHLQDIARSESNIEFLTTYNKNVNDFSLSLSGGGNIMMQNFRDNYMGSAPGVGLIVPGLYNISNIPNQGLNYSNFRSRKAIYSVFGLASMGYKDQIYLDLTARNDWSSTLPADNRSYFYPSASLSWMANYTFNLPQEVSMLKVRAGVAQVGNDTNPYALEPVLGTQNWGGLISTTFPGTLLNPNLMPEINTSQEYGLDLNLFDNRIRFEGTYFYQRNRNQILSIPTPASSGFTQKQINAGMISSRGWEVMIGGTPIQRADGLSLDINVNFTRMRTRLESLTEGMDFITLWDDNNGGAQTFVGDDIGTLYSRGFAYVEDPNSEYYRWPILNEIGKWIPRNDREDRVPVGNFNPDFIMGGQFNLRYKQWSVNASFDWRMGGNFQSYTYRYGESNWKSQRQIDNLTPGGLYGEQELIDLLKSDPERYIIPQNGNFPRVGGYTPETGGLPTNTTDAPGNDGVFIPGVIEVSPGEYVEHLGGEGTVIYPASRQFAWSHSQQITFDASFLKMRELAIGYDLPSIKGIRNAHVAVFTRNVIIWTAANIGIDPERAFQITASRQGDSANLFRQGIELQNVMPWTMPVGFKLNLTF
ncbi:SusC/RagA family TonB-linked outer membrane protein [Pleomorphovibrio marinus]|uniref:SusC/RagA family TonB-linked outer membrane protein n=1 Tax=Pleomorphovibrio marinus TaxID=2164132 RepID=UPI000E0C8FAB|nr:SusC/RagA family TonB-linked outer membrane protein [Pleomorphovibrio marinus]